MIAFDTGGVRFNLRAAAVIVEADSVLLHRLEGDPVWALPGGRVEAGETGAAAVVREMHEETGEAVECGEPWAVVENFFDAGGQAFHELGLYFRATLPPGSRLRDRSTSHDGVEGDRRLEFRWFALRRLGDVDLRPSCLRAALQRRPWSFQHIVQHRQAAPGVPR